MVRPHQGIPPGILLMKDRAHGDLSKISDGKGRGVGHDSMLTKNFKESQWIRKIPIRRHFLANYDGTLIRLYLFGWLIVFWVSVPPLPRDPALSARDLLPSLFSRSPRTL